MLYDSNPAPEPNNGGLSGWEQTLARFVVRDFIDQRGLPRGMDEEDLIQEILLWWVTQRQWYNKQRGASIQTFFRHVARNRLSDIYQEQTTEKRGGTSYPLSLNRPVLNKEGDTAELGDFVPNPKDVASEVEGQIERDRILAWLTPRQRELAQGLAQDYSLAEMARRMKVPRTTLKDELIRIQRILRKNGYRSNDVGNQR